MSIGPELSISKPKPGCPIRAPGYIKQLPPISACDTEEFVPISVFGPILTPLPITALLPIQHPSPISAAWSITAPESIRQFRPIIADEDIVAFWSINGCTMGFG